MDAINRLLLILATCCLASPVAGSKLVRSDLPSNVMHQLTAQATLHDTSRPTLDNTAKFSVADCGTSPFEAQLKGCKFSPMVTSWTPTSCLNSNLDSEWNASGRKYLLDQRSTQETNHDAVTRGDVETYWIDMNTHVAHCVYAFRQIYHAYQQARALELCLRMSWRKTISNIA